MARRNDRRSAPDPTETRFADVAPSFDAFPGLTAGDFDAFLAPKQRDPLRNGERLVVKRKLTALGVALEPALKKAKLALTRRTSLSHPFKHNGFKVASQSVYWGRGEKDKKALKRLLGADLGADVDPAYLGVTLLVEVDDKRVACGLKVHPKAWWDGQNLKKRILASEDEATAMCDLLNALPTGYAMTIGSWRKRYEAGKLRPADIDNYFRYYTPGESWLFLLHETPREEAVAAGPALASTLADRLVAVAPVYRFAAWSKRNDQLLSP